MNPKYMKRAIELAKKGIGYTNPNPIVGCAVVKNDEIIAEGYHEKIGGFHAERNALTSCKDDTTGAELYVTLEPCCHYGKTPPCTEIIIEKKIKKVYVGSMDPNKLVAGKGVKILKEHGIEVECGILKDECDKLNEVFFHYITNKTPYVVMKYAMTLDGKIACENGDSKWVTGKDAREAVQKMRKQYMGIMVGINTVIEDNPMLNCRIEENVDPIRIICDSNLRIPFESNIVDTANKIKTIVVCTNEADIDKQKYLEERGVEVIRQKSKGRVNLSSLMKTLGEKGIDSILLEGGGTLNAQALKENIVNKICCFIAPKIVGGANAKSPIEGKGVEKMMEAYSIENMEIQKLGNDIMLTGYLKRGSQCLQEL